MKVTLFALVGVLAYTCILISSTAGSTQRYCSNQTDCHTHECCVTRTPPRGRRDVTDKPGKCVPLGHAGSSCLVRFGSVKQPPSGIQYGCPCSSPYQCVGNGLIEVPLGERGFCSHI